MIDKQTLIDRMGKAKASEFMANSRSNQPTGNDKERGIRGRVRWRRCEHGVYVIDDYVVKGCTACQEVRKNSKPREFKPYFNIGLGAYVESRSEEKSLAKAKGYTEAG